MGQVHLSHGDSGLQNSRNDFVRFSEELWTESSPEGVLTAFFGVLGTDFGVRRAFCLNFEVQSGKCTFEDCTPVLSRLHPLEALPTSIMRQMRGQISLALSSPEPDTGGVCQSVTEGGIIHWAILGNPKKKGCLCLWEAVARSDSGSSLDMCVQLVQHEYSWYSKLDKTQALLYVDDLTGLYNYRYLDIALESEIRRAERYHQKFCLLFIDMDNFKMVNDHHGHLAGSQVLRQTGSILREELREGDTVIRYGGDEYVIILLGSDCDAGLLVAERIRKRISLYPFEVEAGGAGIRLSCSIGVACFPEHGKNKADLLKIADKTMYQSKHQGKNKVMLFSLPDKREAGQREIC